MPELPGKQFVDTPPLPGSNATQPTAAQRAALEAKWFAMKNAPKALAEIILIVHHHPELIQWAQDAIEHRIAVPQPSE